VLNGWDLIKMSQEKTEKLKKDLLNGRLK